MKKFDVIMNYEIHETGEALNTHECKLNIITNCADGNSFSIKLKQLGRNETECVSDLQRQELFWSGIKSMSLGAVQTEFEEYNPEKNKKIKEEQNKKQYEKERDAFYKDLHKNMMIGKYGEIRKFLADNGINLKVKNGEDKQKLADKIVKAVQLQEKENA